MSNILEMKKMRGRKTHEIDEAIIEAIRKGNRSRNDIRISAGITDYSMLKKYTDRLIIEGKIKEELPNHIDHPHVKIVYVLS